MSFAKVDCALLTSSLWPDFYARNVFMTALLMAKPKTFDDDMQQISVRSLDLTGWVVPAGEYGFVEASGTAIVRSAMLPVGLEEGMGVLESLCVPDKDSRDSRFEGRRMARVNGGYIILNYMRYRNKDSVVERSTTVGYVYYAGTTGGDRVRIAFSKNPWARVADMQSNSKDIKLLAVEKGSLSLKEQREREFASFRVSGEWFRLSETLNKHIVTLPKANKPTTVATVVTTKRSYGSNYEEAEAEAEEDSVNRKSKEKEKVQGEGGCGGTVTLPPTLPQAPVLTFRCQGAVKEWSLFQSEVDAWTRDYPHLDILKECRKAHAWLDVHTPKTAKGMARFLVAWFNRAVDKGDNGKRPSDDGPLLSHGLKVIGPTEDDLRQLREGMPHEHGPDGNTGVEV